MSPVATCRAVHVLARSQEAGMDVWEWGSTLMHACKREVWSDPLRNDRQNELLVMNLSWQRDQGTQLSGIQA